MDDFAIDDADREILRDLLGLHRLVALPSVLEFRVRHEANRHRIDGLIRNELVHVWNGRPALTIRGVAKCDTDEARAIVARLDTLLDALKALYREGPEKSWPAEALSTRLEMSSTELGNLMSMLAPLAIANLAVMQDDGRLVSLTLTERVLDAGTVAEHLTAAEHGATSGHMRIQSLSITGYRGLRNVHADLGALTAVIGANASGKSSILGALRLLGWAATNPIPPDVDPFLPPGARVFTIGAKERVQVRLAVTRGDERGLDYQVEVHGPVGRVRVAREQLDSIVAGGAAAATVRVMDFREGKGKVRDPSRLPAGEDVTVPTNELALRRAVSPSWPLAAAFREYVAGWRLYSGFDTSRDSLLRQPTLVDTSALLLPDGANLNAVLHEIVLGHPDEREEIESALRSALPGFDSFTVKTRAKGHAAVAWTERGIQGDMSLADLSDGTLSLLGWLALAAAPQLPSLVCIDEPEVGLHPRVFPLLAAALRRASERTQVILATHSPELLSSFELDEIAVLRRGDAGPEFVRPNDSASLRREVEEIGGEAIGRLFVSDELEARA